MTLKLLVATRNPGKVAEYRDLLADLSLEITYLDTEGITLEVDETGHACAENARLKALAYADVSGLWTWADDSGLEVDALDGAPGVHSARYGGPGLDDAGRYYRLLRAMKHVPAEARSARFRCVVAIATPTGLVRTATGVCEGQIAHAPRGEHGFGYDPVFIVEGYGDRTMAELPLFVKNQISHRGRAARAARALLAQMLAEVKQQP